MKSEVLRRSAEGQECTFKIPGVCNHDPSTTVLCHLPSRTGGMALKSSDQFAAFGCSACHAVVDGHVPNVDFKLDKYEYLYTAQQKTREIWAAMGLEMHVGAK